jgi:hypothetical protein
VPQEYPDHATDGEQKDLSAAWNEQMRAFAKLAERDMHMLNGKNLAWALNAVKGCDGYAALFRSAAARLLQVQTSAEYACDGVPPAPRAAARRGLAPPAHRAPAPPLRRFPCLCSGSTWQAMSAHAPHPTRQHRPLRAHGA